MVPVGVKDPTFSDCFEVRSRTRNGLIGFVFEKSVNFVCFTVAPGKTFTKSEFVGTIAAKGIAFYCCDHVPK